MGGYIGLYKGVRGLGFRVWGNKNLGYLIGSLQNTKDYSILGVHNGVPLFRETTKYPKSLPVADLASLSQ